VSVLDIRDLQVSVKLPDGGTKPILAGVTLNREIGGDPRHHGPQRVRESTLAYSIAGHPKYQITGR